MPSNWMLDMETFGMGPSPRIVSLAFVRFDLGGPIGKPHHYHIVQATAPGETGAQTFLWWLAQPKEAQNALLEGQKQAVPFGSAMLAMDAVISRDARLWCRGHDWMWLENLWKEWGGTFPFSFRKFRDMRFCDDICKAPEMAGTKHDALIDCLRQIEHLRLAIATVPGMEVLLG